MSRFTNGWTWLDTASEEQMTAVGVEARCDLYAQHIASLYHEIPEPGDERWENNLNVLYEQTFENSRYEDPITAHLEAKQACEQAQSAREAQVKLRWDQIEFFENKLNELGARLRRDYEHYNEDELRIAAQENP